MFYNILLLKVLKLIQAEKKLKKKLTLVIDVYPLVIDRNRVIFVSVSPVLRSVMVVLMVVVVLY